MKEFVSFMFFCVGSIEGRTSARYSSSSEDNRAGNSSLNFFCVCTMKEFVSFMFVLCLYHERICFVQDPRSPDRISIFVFYVHAYNDEAKLGEHTNEHSIAD